MGRSAVAFNSTELVGLDSPATHVVTLFREGWVNCRIRRN